MFNNLNNNIITKSLLCKEIAKNTVSDDIFAKTISFAGIQQNFHIDIPEIISYEKQLQDRQDDIRKFTNLAMSDVASLSHNEVVENIYLQDDFANSEFEQQLIKELSHNKRLLQDLGL